jgi:hypothetical protein
MFRNTALTLAVTLWGLGSLLLPPEALAQTPLSRAVLQSLKNRAQLIPRNQQARPARVSDAMAPGDALATAKASAAQLRFNDGSLARLGEQAVFKFVPGTRTFQLSNGTALVLIPPGRGTTNVRTPNAAAGIRGSALFVRYNPETQTTLVGALTTSGIQVFNRDSSQNQELKAGYMAVIAKDRIERVYEFDLDTFYRTSELVRGLDLTQTGPVDNSDEAIASVRAETSQAAKAQPPVTGENVIENPSFVQLSADTSNTSGDFPRTDTDGVDSNPTSREPNFSGLRNTTDVRSLLEGGQILDNRTRNNPDGNGNGGDNPGRGNDPGTGNNPPGPGGNGNGGDNPGRGNDPGTGNNPPGPGGNGNGGNDNPGRGNDPGTGNNPPGPGGNGNGGNDNPGRGNDPGTGNNPPGPGGNGNGGNDNPGRGNDPGTGNNPPGPGGNGAGGNDNPGRGNAPGTGNNPPGPGGNGAGGNDNPGRGNAPGTGNNPPGPGGNGAGGNDNPGRGNAPGTGNNPPGPGGNGAGGNDNPGRGNNSGRGTIQDPTSNINIPGVNLPAVNLPGVNVDVNVNPNTD